MNPPSDETHDRRKPVDSTTPAPLSIIALDARSARRRTTTGFYLTK
jgi:hypothetical protein